MARTVPVLIRATCVPVLWPTYYQLVRDSAHLQHNSHSKRVTLGATSQGVMNPHTGANTSAHKPTASRQVAHDSDD